MRRAAQSRAADARVPAFTAAGGSSSASASPAKSTSVPAHRGGRTLSVQVCSIDYYLTTSTLDPHTNHFVESANKVPVIRVFGPDPDGQKCCLHVHGVFPYFYVGLSNQQTLQCLRQAHGESVDVQRAALNALAEEIGKELNKRMRAKLAPDRRQQFVREATVMMARPFYGYHTQARLFVKVSAYSPRDIPRMVQELRRAGAVGGQSVLSGLTQTYESHVPYLLQFFLDHDVYGMGFVNVDGCVHRRPSATCTHLRWDTTEVLGHSLRAQAKQDQRPAHGGGGGGRGGGGGGGAAAVATAAGGQVRPGEGGAGGAGASVRSLQKVSWCEVEADTLACWIKPEGGDQCDDTGGGGSGGNVGEVNEEPFQFLPSLKRFWAEDQELRKEYGMDAATPTSTPTSPANERRKSTTERSYLRHFKQWMAARRREAKREPAAAEGQASAALPSARNGHRDGGGARGGGGGGADQLTRPGATAGTPQLQRGLSGSQESSFSTQQLDGSQQSAQQYSQEAYECLALLDVMFHPQAGIADTPTVDPSSGPHVVPGDGSWGTQESRLSQLAEPRSPADRARDFVTLTVNEFVQLTQQQQTIAPVPPSQQGTALVLTPRQLSASFDGAPDNNDPGDADDSCGEDTEDDGEGVWTDAAKATQQFWQDVGRPALPDASFEAVVANAAARGRTKETQEPSASAIRRSDSNGKLALRAVELAPSFHAPTLAQLEASEVKLEPMAQRRLVVSSQTDVRAGSTLQIGTDLLQQFQPRVNAGWSPIEHSDTAAARDVGRGLQCLEPTFHPPPPGTLEWATPQLAPISIEYDDAPASPDPIANAQVDSSLAAESGECAPDAPAAETGATTRAKFVGTIASSLIRSGSAASSGDAPVQGAYPTKRKAHGKKRPSSATQESKALSRHLLILSAELICESTNGRLPDPLANEVLVFCYCFVRSGEVPSKSQRRGYIAQRKVVELSPAKPDRHHDSCDRQPPFKTGWMRKDVSVQTVDSEQALIMAIVHLVRTHDPDVMLGWEVQKASWGFLFKRAQVVFDHSFMLDRELSRLYPSEPGDSRHYNDEWGAKKASEIHIVGRVVFNVWRLMRSDLTLSSYTIQNVAAETLRIRLPEYKHSVLHEWVTSTKLHAFDRAIAHSIALATTTLEVLEHLDFINRTSEFARMYGIDLLSVTTRGSQYRVEAVMLRILRRMADRDKNEAYVLPSPSREDVANQRGLAAIAVNMEPASALYTAPVAVLDFQSLYPSIMISRNICFSTCLGRMQQLAGVSAGADMLLTEDEAARVQLDRAAGLVEADAPSSSYFASRLGVIESYCPSLHAVKSVKQSGATPDVFIADNGVVFVGKQTRKGVLPRMLEDILTMRVLVKQTLKEARKRKDKTVARILDSRQLGLKLLANVTYGYTAASFSGRMPCVEIADAIVLTGRGIWHDTTAFVQSEWRQEGAKVVYGDTDSVFVHLPHANVTTAFDIGAQIARKCTERHPSPVKLKLEKVYEHCILATKKRYAGYMHETRPARGQAAVLDMKGIHAVRRDGFPALVKIMKRVLHILFSTLDMSLVRSYVQRQCRKILNNTASAQDLILRQELKGPYRQPPPHAVVVTKMVYHDPQAHPMRGQRVPYMIVYGSAGATIRELAVPPSDVLACADWVGTAPEVTRAGDDHVVRANEVVEIPLSAPSQQADATDGSSKGLSFPAMAKAFFAARNSRGRRPVGRGAAAHTGAPKPAKTGRPPARSATQKYIPNGLFYVRRINQALDSILRLCKNTDCYEWTKNLGREVATRNRRFNVNAMQQMGGSGRNSTLDAWAHTLDCANCFRKTNHLFCDECVEDTQALHANVMYRLAHAQRAAILCASQCSACADRGGPRVVEATHLVGIRESYTCGGGVHCASLDCPAFYSRLRAAAQLRFAALTANALSASTGPPVMDSGADSGAAPEECDEEL